MTIWFDMDGTIADLYGVEGWLDALRAYDPTPYAVAPTMLNMSVLARMLNRIQRKGIHIGIISWLSKESTPEYDELVSIAKREWLNKHLPSVHWDEIEIVPYGTNKFEHCHGGWEDFLFDDDKRNLDQWEGFGFTPDNIVHILKMM